MTTNYFDPDGTAKVTVPVKRVGERWEFFYGGDVPVREGTLGELTINANQITDDRFQKQVTQEPWPHRVKVSTAQEGTATDVSCCQRVDQSASKSNPNTS